MATNNFKFTPVDKKRDLFEWTQTFELGGFHSDSSMTAEELLQQTLKPARRFDAPQESDSFLINDYVLSLEANPFYQPSMHTNEFANQLDGVDAGAASPKIKG